MAATEEMIDVAAHMIAGVPHGKHMLRTVVQDEPYTAVLLKDNRVLEVKGPRPHIAYESKEAWAASLGVAMDQVIEEAVPKKGKEKNAKKEKVVKEKVVKEKKVKAKKEPKAKPKKFNVPTKTSRTDASSWMYHVHEMIMGAEVPKTDELIDAYNTLVDYLRQQYTLRTYCPVKSVKYQLSIQLRQVGYNIVGLSMYYNPEVLTPARVAISTEIMRLYKPMYDIISPLVVPYMAVQHVLITAEQTKIRYNNALLKIHEQMEREMQDHMTKMKYFQNNAISYQAEIDKSQTILDASKKA